MALRVAIITMVYNEDFFLPKWCQYYGSQFGYENLFIIDHGSTDGSTSCVPGNIIRIPRINFDDTKRTQSISLFQNSLMGYFDAVIYVDCDEFLVPNKKLYENLRKYVDTHADFKIIRAVGVDVMQESIDSHSINLEYPFLSQREYGYFSPWETKPLLTYTAVEWSPGFHNVNKPSILDENLWLLHLKDIDLSRSLNRMALTRNLKWSDHALKTGGGSHQRLDDKDVIEKFENIIKTKENKFLLPSEAMSYISEHRISNLMIIPDEFKVC
ncbi:hypothetical protein AA18889_1459 [Acetobacter senegalensis DSM 18889]|nr:hypothetical protein AA18889_1459 [Acetobacter senegalensis DSM 18889]